MRKHWRKIIMVSAMLVLVMFILTDGFSSYSLKRFRTRNGYVLDIRTDLSWEQGQPVRCWIKQGWTTIEKTTIGIIGGDSGELRFAVIEKNDIIALIEKSAPNVVVLLFDTQNQRVWTGWTIWNNRAIGEALLEELNQLRPGQAFVLSSDAYSDPRVKIH